MFTIESFHALAPAAQQRFAELAYDNINIKDRDDYAVWQEEAPFDKIIISFVLDAVPQTLVDQLADGGRLIAITDEQTLTLVKKEGNKPVSKTMDIPSEN